jgi:adenosylcobyric acid synthase
MKDLMLMSTHSGVGKNFVLTGLVRLLKRVGISVSPFKGFSVDEYTCALAEDVELAFAQVLQSIAAQVPIEPCQSPLIAVFGNDPHVRLLGRRKQIDGNPIEFFNREYNECCAVVQESLAYLRQMTDSVIIEGAGSPSEPALQSLDIPNLFVARSSRPVILLMTETYWGGGFAHLKGTFDLLPEDVRQLVKGFILNKALISGRKNTFADNVKWLEDATEVPVISVIPPFERVTIPSEQLLHPITFRELVDLTGGIDEHANLLSGCLDVNAIVELISE